MALMRVIPLANPIVRLRFFTPLRSAMFIVFAPNPHPAPIRRSGTQVDRYPSRRFPLLLRKSSKKPLFFDASTMVYARVSEQRNSERRRVFGSAPGNKHFTPPEWRIVLLVDL